MPAVLRDVVMRELRRENGGADLDVEDIYEIDGPLDLRCLRELPVADTGSLSFPAVSVRSDPLPGGQSIWSLIDERDRLCHHPFDAFDATVGRFFAEAAADPGVTAIKMTVYRADENSPIVSSLARCGRGRQGRRRLRRAEGPLRRGAECRMGAAPRGRRRTRRSRPCRHQDPRQGRARRAARRRGPPEAIRPRRHRQLQRTNRASIHRLLVLFTSSEASRRRAGSLQRADGPVPRAPNA